jgi:hypothetical protein
MVEHLVLFKVRAGTDTSSVSSMVAGLKGLKAQIPGIVDLTVGTNFSDRSKGFTHGLVVRFQDRAALDAYLPNPAHREAVERLIRPITEDVIVIDYEIYESGNEE